MWLSDAKKRDIYDEHGTETNFRQNYHQYFREEEEFDPFDLFDLFTGGNTYRQRVRRRHPQRHHYQQQRQQQGDQQNWQQFVPLLFILFLMIIANIGSHLASNPNYSFQKTQVYKKEMQSSTHNVIYYVDLDTYNSLKESRHETEQLESSVEQDFYK